MEACGAEGMAGVAGGVKGRMACPVERRACVL